MSGGVDEAAVTLGSARRYQLDHSSVYRLRAEASAGGENERTAVNAQFETAVFFIRCKELGAHGKSRQHAGILRLEIFSAAMLVSITTSTCFASALFVTPG